jgi:uroporphyrinogen-III decarboxylase
MQGQTQDFNDEIRYKNWNQKPAERVAQKPSTSKQSPPICHICEISCSMFLQMYKETMQQTSSSENHENSLTALLLCQK